MNPGGLPAPAPDLFGMIPEEWECTPFLDGDGYRVPTGERIRDRQPLLYRAVVALSSIGQGSATIAAQLGCSDRLVRAIKHVESQTVAAGKEQFGRLCLGTAARLVGRVNEQIDEMEGRDAAIAAGILVDKGLLLTGAATQIVEQRRGPAEADVRAWLASHAIDVTPASARIPEQTGGGTGTPEYQSGVVACAAAGCVDGGGSVGVNVEAAALAGEGGQGAEVLAAATDRPTAGGLPTPAAEAGGGVPPRGAAPTDDGSSGCKISHQGDL